MSFYLDKTRNVAWLDYWKKIETACKDFLKDKIRINEFKQIIGKMPDDNSYPPFTFHKTHLKDKLLKLLGQNWRRSYPFPLRDAIYDAVELLYSIYSEEVSSKMKEMSDEKTHLKRSKHARNDSVLKEPEYKEIFEEVYQHLQLFGINLDSPKVIDNIYYHHQPQRSQNTDP